MYNSFLKISHLLVALLFICSYKSVAQTAEGDVKSWVGTWSTAPQLVEQNNMPPSPGLANNSLRQVVRVSIGGDTLRLRFSNSFSNSPVTMNSVKVAVSTGGSNISEGTSKQLAFNGNTDVTMQAGEIVSSDPLAFPLEARMTLAITIHYGQVSSSVTGHPGSRTTSYLVSGTSENFANAVTTDHWYNIFGIDVLAPPSAASVAILGNSITDGRGTTTNMQNRWTDILSERLVKNIETREVGILNMGIGGNCVLKNCLGPSAVNRFERDILNQPKVKVAIIAIGVNDIGGVNNGGAATTVANDLIAAFTLMIESAKAKNIKVYGATIMPFKGNSYYNQYSEACRKQVNEWIRTSGKFDDVIDFDQVMKSSQDNEKIESSFENDGLHPDAAGYKKMGESIDLNLFKGLGATLVTGNYNGEHTVFNSNNYPNPFSDYTTISFDIPSPSYVSLKIITTQGEVIAELAGTDFPAGKYAVNFDGRGLSEGINFYSLVTSTYSETRKIILIGK